MRNKQKFFICLVLFSIPFLMEFPGEATAEAPRFHTKKELTQFETLQDSLLPDGYNGLFTGSGACLQCHGFDTAGIASVNILGEDINLVDDWRASMMANSAKDPFWRAKVSHEVLLYPQHQQAIETKCTSCHAPLGHFAAMHNGQQYYSMAEMLSDSIAQDGVSCLACHQQDSLDLGDLNSGHLNFDTAKVAYGPFISPLESPMVMATDYKPVHSEHIRDAGICAGCHTLITETLDYDGNFTGNVFVEQATYHEWLNSTYNEDDISCQSCHLEAMSKGEVILIAGFETEPRSPFYLHELAGANIFMLELFRDNIETLGLAATEEQFEEAISATEDMLYNKSISLDLQFLERTADTVFFEMEITNLAGHKFPSGYPSRRVFVEFLLENVNGDTLFISGKRDENFEVIGHNADFEPHYNTIRSEDEVQIYELVVGDVNNEVTTVLLRGDSPLKDNRIPPKGFVTEHPAYDTTQIAGLALEDENFNISDGLQGSGTDKVYFNIPLQGHDEALIATAKIYYQTAPPKWMAEMFAEQTPEIDEFRALFDAANREPILIKQRTEAVDIFVGVEEKIQKKEFARLVSTLAANGELSIQSDEFHDYMIYNLNGSLMRSNFNQSGAYDILLNLPTGAYFIRFLNTKGYSNIQKFIVP